MWPLPSTATTTPARSTRRWASTRVGAPWSTRWWSTSRRRCRSSGRQAARGLRPAGTPGIEGESPGATHPEDKEGTGQSKILLEMNELIEVAELRVEDQRNDQTEGGKGQRRDARVASGHYHDASSEFERDRPRHLNRRRAC